MATQRPEGEAIPRDSAFRKLSKQPRIILMLLAAWSVLAALPQIFVNSGAFLDIHDIELDGALGGFAMGLQSIPLAVLYLFCARSPSTYPNIFWLAFIHQGVLVAAVLYHLVIGTFSFESVVVPLVGGLLLATLALLQVFEPKHR